MGSGWQIQVVEDRLSVVQEINILPPFPTGIAADRPASPLLLPVNKRRRYSLCVRWLRMTWSSVNGLWRVATRRMS